MSSLWLGIALPVHMDGDADPTVLKHIQLKEL